MDIQRGVPVALVRSLADGEDTLVDWGWDTPAIPAPASVALPEWPDRIEGLSYLVRKELLRLPWTAAEAVTTQYGSNRGGPAPVAFQALWQDYKADLKKAGIVFTLIRGQGWTAPRYFCAKGENAGS